MQQEIELREWNSLLKRNSFLKNKIKKMQKIDIKSIGFFDSLKVCDNSIYGNYGVGYNTVNAIIIKKLIDIFIKLDDENANEYFLLSSDGSFEGVEIIKDLICLNNTSKKFLTFEKFLGFDKKFISSSVKKICPFGAIHISKSIWDKNIITLTLFDANGLKIKNNLLQGLLDQISKTTEDCSYDANRNISFLDNDTLVKIFVEKISELFPKSITARKTKIAISNRSEGICQIISKVIGRQDFSYIVNEKVKNKEIDVLKKKNVSDRTIKKYFRSEIWFAIKKRANFLITFNKEGTQIFLFYIYGRKVIYLNSNLVSLIFLHKFYNDLGLEDRKLPNSFIASNSELTGSLKNLTKKYGIFFKKITNNDFLNQQEYMLLYWNNYNQFVFGEKTNDEFTIYHLLVKIIGIIDYFNGQYNSINSLISSITKMYGDLMTQKMKWFKQDYNTMKNNISNFVSKHNNRSPILSQNKIDIQEPYSAEDDLWTMELKNGTKIVVRYNKILNKTYFYLNYKFTFNIISDIAVYFKNKRAIKKLTKSKS